MLKLSLIWTYLKTWSHYIVTGEAFKTIGTPNSVRDIAKNALHQYNIINFGSSAWLYSSCYIKTLFCVYRKTCSWNILMFENDTQKNVFRLSSKILFFLFPVLMNLSRWLSFYAKFYHVFQHLNSVSIYGIVYETGTSPSWTLLGHSIIST